MSHTNLTDINRSNELDLRPNSTSPAPGLHDDRYVIDELREQLALQNHRIEKMFGLLEAQDDQIAQLEVREQRLNEKIADIQEQWRIKFDNLRHQIQDGKIAPTAKAAPVNQYHEPMPAAEDISAVSVELYENFGQGHGKTRAKVQLKIRIDGFASYWLMPLHRPNMSIGRKRIKPLLSEIDAIGRDLFKYAGCRHGDREQAYVDNRDRLCLQIDGKRFAFGPGKSSRDGDDANAPKLRWFCTNDTKSE